MPANRSMWPTVHVDADTAADVALLLSGVRLPLAGPVQPQPDGSVRTELLGDSDGIVLVDDEATPIASIDRHGALEPMGRATGASWHDHQVGPGEVRQGLPAGTLGTLRDRPLTAASEEQLRSGGQPVLILAQVGAGRLPDDVLVRCLADSVARLPQARLAAVPLAARNRTPSTEADLVAQYGASGTFRPVAEPDWAAVLAALDAEAELPVELGSPVTRAELRRWRAPLRRRGLTVFFTGLSGSGKSTIAAALMRRLAGTERTATLLDGDRVRRLLSSGLGFAREERETNVRRIGWVAAQITHHGGIAVCAPIAPYASTRDWVRREVGRSGDFLLVYVATPLEVCEARDRKGLYVAARAGRIPQFTGVSDPYEPATEADLVLDTTERSVESCVQEVMDRLAEHGWVATAGVGTESLPEQ